MKYLITIVPLVLGICISNSHARTFLDDGQVKLIAKNYFFNRDYKKDSPDPAARDWAQGFILKAQSGFTDGKIGLGIDALGLVGFNLLSQNSNYVTANLLPVHQNNERPHTTGEFRLTVKAKISETTLQAGTLTPMFPVLFSSPTRLFQQNYQGAHIQSDEINNLTLHAIYVDRVNQRDSTNFENLQLGNPNRRFEKGAISSGLHLFGGEYQLDNYHSIQFYHSVLHDIYQQNYLELKSKVPLFDGNLNAITRLFVTKDNQDSLAGNIDNQHFSGSLGFNQNHHTFTVGYMQSFGDSALPTLSGIEPFVVIDSMNADFINQDEKVYMLRYDYDFQDTYLQGLKVMTRYTKGFDIHLPQFPQDNFKQNAWDIDLNYKVQSGILTGLNLRARYMKYRNDLPTNGMAFRSDDEVRIITEYTWEF